MQAKYDEILDCVCEMCGVEKDKLFSEIMKSPYPHTRGLYWSFIRRITGFSSEHIGKITSKYGKCFCGASVRISMFRVSAVISQDKVWKKRWRTLIERFDERREQHEQIKITISAPEEIKHLIKVEINGR